MVDLSKNGKKVCILCTANIMHMTLISIYTNKLTREGICFDIIYIDKYGVDEQYYGARELYKYRLKLKENWPLFKKLLKYFGFKKYAINIIRKEAYDFIVVWNEFTAFMFSNYLAKKYKNKYCINIRDQNFNNIPLVQARYKKAIVHSCFSTISSERFRNIYPRYDYLFVHSFNDNVIKDIKPSFSLKKSSEKLNIVFTGRVSYPKTAKEVICALGNDSRFELFFYGIGSEQLIETIEKNKFYNIHTHGAFNSNETANYLKNADIIYSLNEENDLFSDSLLPIKLYYSISKMIPILCFRSSYTFEYSSANNFAIGITSSDFNRLGDVIFNQYHSLSFELIKHGCQNAMEEVRISRNKLDHLIDEFILQ